MDLLSVPGVQVVSQDESLPLRPLMIVIYGPPGLGKTSLASTAPKPFLYDYDNGIHRAIQRIRPYAFSVQSYDAMRSMIDGALPEQVQKHQYKTAIIDTAGTMLDNHLAPWLIKQNAKNGNNQGGLSMSGWGALAVEFKSNINKHRKMGVNIILIAHAKEDDNGVNLDMKGGSKGAVFAEADLIGYIYMEGQKRMLSFKPAQGRIGKNTGNLPVFQIPDESSAEYDGFMTRVIAQVQQSMQSMTDKQREAVAAIEKHTSTIKACTTFEQLADVVSEYEDLGATHRAALGKVWNQRYAEIYSECHFAALVEPVDFAKAMGDIKENVDDEKQLQVAIWGKLLEAGKAAGVSYDRDNRTFIKDEEAVSA